MSEFNKAIMAVVGGVATVVAHYTGFEMSPAMITAIGTVITTVLVYAVPNRAE